MSDAEQAMLALMHANEEQRLLIVELMAERDAFQREAAWRDSEQRREAAEWAKEGATLRAEVERLRAEVQRQKDGMDQAIVEVAKWSAAFGRSEADAEALRGRICQLWELVRAAYAEGWHDRQRETDPHAYSADAWDMSAACAALEEPKP